MITDTHTHLYSEQFDEDRVMIVQRAFDAECQSISLFLLSTARIHNVC